jgi:hypothetical protein
MRGYLDRKIGEHEKRVIEMIIENRKAIREAERRLLRGEH